ncbi:TonB-dependent hemoglobin/transferrin/lactoferrin family receptor [Woeseia oceani]|uniref:TonB-dependent receptor n=1 Tax=Woeseia oceani TaxID=1548547 RepID=A0A193LCE4_9GAMM|nr:TonB-dependent hemoglobin/transferrin/lactoferrin family receptor [Woeseia oceani]ANO50138.1 hypothetical protein BA177_01910 [Woeseia oceani]
MLSAIALAFAPVAALATVPATNEAEIETITVEAAKIPMSASDITSSITLIDDARISQELAQTIDDLVRYEPGVDVVDQGSRFGLSGISIRGIGGNRVKIEVDGVATSEAFSVGSYSNASRDFVDVNSLKQVEVIRGPASAVFGSDALGGVVSFVTKGPYDLLHDSDRYADLSAGFNSVDASRVLRVTGAARTGKLSTLLRVNARDGQEQDVVDADPFTDESLNLLARFEWGEYGNGALGLSIEHFEVDSATEVDSLEGRQDFSAQFGFPYIIDTTAIAADDRKNRTRLSLGQDWLDGRFGTNYLRWRAYSQDSQTRQDTYETRESFIAGTASAVTRDRRFTFDQSLTGLEINAASEFATTRASHLFAYGIEHERTDTEQLRDGRETDLISDEISAQVGPDLYPVRDFPKSRTRRSGIYLQDSIALGPVTISPGLRWDRYELEPVSDSIFAEDNPGIVTATLDEDRVSPKLGVLWSISEQWSAYAQYAEGFRAPPANDVNVGFTNFQFGYTTLPNPDLKSETSVGYETGLRYSGDAVSWDLAVFDTRYDDFIESFQVVGFDPVNQLIQFQSVNVDKVDIAGAEFKGQFLLPLFSEQLTLRVSAAYAKGKNRATGTPLNSVAPLNGIAGLDFKHDSGRWGTSLVARAARRQNNLDESAGALLSPSGYAVFDSFGYWQPSENTRLRAGIYNLTDRDYTAYLDVQGVPADVTNAAQYQRPGRHFSIAIDWTL